MAALSDVLTVAGVTLPLERTATGPLLSTKADPRLEPLAWVANAAVTGMLPDLRVDVAAGRDVAVQGLFAARPDPNDPDTAAAAAWRELTGHDPGPDTYVVGTTFSEASLLLPREGLLQILDALVQVRAGNLVQATIHDEIDRSPDGIERPSTPGRAELDATRDELERRAAEIEKLAGAASGSADGAGALSAKRRFLLMALDQAGFLSADPPPAGAAWPLLSGYRAAAVELLSYLASAERNERVAPEGGVPPAIIGAPVTLDWFRVPSRRPDPLEPSFRWLARCEHLFRAAPIEGDAAAGEVFLRSGSSWWALVWRRDDGVTPALVSARPAV